MNSEEKETFTVNNDITCTSISTISKHTKAVSSLLLLKDNRISSCSYENSISIFDPANNFNCDMTLLGHNDLIFSLCQLDDSRLVSCSHDCEIKIWDISNNSYQCAVTIKKAHDAHIFKVISLPNNKFASCSRDCAIKIWDMNASDVTVPIGVINKAHVDDIYSLLYMREKDVLVSSSDNTALRVWNLKNYKILMCQCSGKNSLYQLNEVRVIVGGWTTVQIWNIVTMENEFEINDKNVYFIYCFMKLKEKIILCGCGSGKILIFKNKTKKYSIETTKHTDGISDLLKVDENTFVSCFLDTTIKVWKF